jgi:SEC-C motif-containing protein
MTNTKCHCCSSKSFVTCCEPLLNGNKIAATAIDLMRSRYSAYVLQHIDYLIATTHRSERDNYSREELLNWASSNTWLQLEIIDFIENKVEFKAYFLNDQNQKQIHHELSTFIFENGSWFYSDGEFF